MGSEQPGEGHCVPRALGKVGSCQEKVTLFLLRTGPGMTGQGCHSRLMWPEDIWLTLRVQIGCFTYMHPALARSKSVLQLGKQTQNHLAFYLLKSLQELLLDSRLLFYQPPACKSF